VGHLLGRYRLDDMVNRGWNLPSGEKDQAAQNHDDDEKN
jgi:hypothetical protein